jgi:hypothetical protein
LARGVRPSDNQYPMRAVHAKRAVMWVADLRRGTSSFGARQARRAPTASFAQLTVTHAVSAPASGRKACTVVGKGKAAKRPVSAPRKTRPGRRMAGSRRAGGILRGGGVSKLSSLSQLAAEGTGERGSGT